MKFNFKAIKSTGERYEGVREAVDERSLYSELKKTGDTVISVFEVKGKKNNSLVANLSGLFGRVGASEKINFAKNLGSMIDSGLPMTRSLSVLERQTRNKKFKTIISRIQQGVGRGESLSESVTQFPEVFSPLFVSMVRAGEESGSIAKSLKSVSEQMERTRLLVSRLRGAMIYPAIVISVMLIISVLLLIFLVPTLTQTFSELDLDLPLSTRIIIGLSSFLKENTFSSLLILVFLVSSMAFIFRTKGGRRVLSFSFLKMPVISALIKESNSARTARTLSSLLSAGVDFLVAIQITQEVVQNPFYKKVLNKAEENVKKGDSIASVFLEKNAQNLYPPFVGEMVSIGEETGKLSEMFSNIADFYEEEVNQKTKNFSTIVEPVLMVFIGLFVGIFAVSMLGPIYSLVDAL